MTRPPQPERIVTRAPVPASRSKYAPRLNVPKKVRKELKAMVEKYGCG